MWSFLRRRLLWFLIGFVITFVVYLFFEFPDREVIRGMIVAVVAGAVLSVIIFFLERRFPDKPREPKPARLASKPDEQEHT